MRQITVKYSGDCQKCGNTLPVGESAIYERRVGIFCVGCAPTDPEEIRAVRQVGADRKADRLEEWAEKREEKASTVLNSHSEIRHDWAFITQPGHIPFRARMIAADDRAHESLNVARGFRARAEGLRHVRVEGDAERKREIEREYTRQWIQLGMQVHTTLYGIGAISKINKKTATVDFGSHKYNVCLSWLAPTEEFKEQTIGNIKALQQESRGN